MQSDTPMFSWVTLSHDHIDRSIDWFWALGVIALAGAAVSVILGNFLLGAIIIVAAVAFGMLAAKGPRECSIMVSERGIAIDRRLYPFRSLKSFWIDATTRTPPHLILAAESLLSPQVVIPLTGELDARSLREFLLKRLEEVEQYESPITRIVETLGL